MKLSRDKVRSTSRFARQPSPSVTPSKPNNNLVKIFICDGSKEYRITMEELGLNEESTLLDLHKMIKKTPPIADRIKPSPLNFHKFAELQVNSNASKAITVDNMYLNLLGTCQNDFDVDTTTFEIHIWVRNLLVLLQRQAGFDVVQKGIVQRQSGFDVAEKLFGQYLQNEDAFDEKVLKEWASDNGIDIKLIDRLFNLAIKKVPSYETTNKGLMDPNGINFNYKTIISVLKYTTMEIDEDTYEDTETMNYIFPLFIYRILDLKKIQAIIFGKEYIKINRDNNRKIDNSVPGTKTDLQMYDLNYGKNKIPNLVIEVSLEIIYKKNPVSEPELEPELEPLPEEVPCVPNGFCSISGGKNKRKTITKKKKVNFLKKRKTKVLKKRKTKKRIMK
jgi:hypothetical protein